MRAKLLDSKKLTTFENGCLINRRNVLMGSGLCATLVIGSPFFLKSAAYAQHSLINAFLNSIALAREIWTIFHPTAGQVTIVNRYDVVSEGFLLFQVVGPRDVENAGYFRYSVPPQGQNTYAFDDGPYGTFPGHKLFNGKTAKGQMATRMYVSDNIFDSYDHELRSDFSASVIPSRFFAGPNQYPPREFAAYGILAFRSRPSSYNRDRYSMICEAYATALPHASELAVPRGKQMVTVWPLNSDDSSAG